MTKILTVAVIILAIYVYRNLRVSNYFFQISLEWQKISKLLGLQEGWREGAEIEDNFKERGVAHFEYYIIPKAMQKPFQSSHIFDQQTKTFSESPSTIHHLLKGRNKVGNNFFVTCGFSKVTHNKKSCFWVDYREEVSELQSEDKTIVALFDEKYLNIKNTNVQASQKIPFEAYLIKAKRGPDIFNKTIPETEKLKTDDSGFGIEITPQSDIEKRGVPFWEELRKISEKPAK